MKVNSHNEWDRLLEVIVGTAKGTRATLTWARPEPADDTMVRRALDLVATAQPQWLLDEVEEDLDGLAAHIERFGVRVHRPTVHDFARVFTTPFWQSSGSNSYNVRDLHLVVGNTVVESASHMHSRYFEAMALYDIWYHYVDQGLRWIAAPRPRLDRPISEAYVQVGQTRELTREDRLHMDLAGGRLETLHRLKETEIVFEAANTLRMGRDLLYLVSSSGNYRGAKWLQSALGEELRVHTTAAIYRSSHIDSTALCLRPGLVLSNRARVNESNCPPLFASWEKIYFEEVAPTPESELALQHNLRDPLARQIEALGFTTNLGDMSSPWVGINLLSLDPSTVMVEERQAKLIRLLERRGFTVVPVRMRHMYTQCGGIHCATLDTVRASTLESYFD